MSSPKAHARKQAEALEAALVHLYLDASARRLLEQDPEALARELALDAEQTDALAAIDRAGLALMAESLAHKRAGGEERQRARAPWRRWLQAARQRFG